MAEGFSYRIEQHEEYVYIHQAGRLTDAGARRLLQELEARLLASNVRKAVFDNRNTEAPDEPVRQRMWDWIENAGLLDKVALILESSLTVVRTNMTALSRRVQLRAFDSVTEAATWLLSAGDPSS